MKKYSALLCSATALAFISIAQPAAAQTMPGGTNLGGGTMGGTAVCIGYISKGTGQGAGTSLDSITPNLNGTATTYTAVVNLNTIFGGTAYSINRATGAVVVTGAETVTTSLMWSQAFYDLTSAQQALSVDGSAQCMGNPITNLGLIGGA